MRNRRQHQVDRALARALYLSAPYLLPESVLKAETARAVVPRATETEVADSLSYHDAAQRLTSVNGEIEPAYKLNAQGQAWLSENA